MSASKTKKVMTDPKKLKRSVQLIVFAPINADPDDEDSHIFMVCPSSLKVVEVIEKFDDDAINFVESLGSKKRKKEKPADEIMEDLAKEYDGEIEVAGELQEEVKEIIEEKEEIASISDELDEDVVAFASGKLDDIFPDDKDTTESTVGVDMTEALDILNQEDDDSDLVGLTSFGDEGNLPEL